MERSNKTGRGKGGLASTFACFWAAAAGVSLLGTGRWAVPPAGFEIFLMLPYFLRSYVLSYSALVRQIVYQVCCTRYHVSFYLWLIGSVLKDCKVPECYY